MIAPFSLTSLPLPLSGGKRGYRLHLSLTIVIGLYGVGVELEPPIGEREGPGGGAQLRRPGYESVGSKLESAVSDCPGIRRMSFKPQQSGEGGQTPNH